MALMTKDRAEWMRDYELREEKLMDPDGVSMAFVWGRAMARSAAANIDRIIRDMLTREACEELFIPEYVLRLYPENQGGNGPERNHPRQRPAPGTAPTYPGPMSAFHPRDPSVALSVDTAGPERCPV